MNELSENPTLEDDSLEWLHPSLRAGFVALPNNPDTALSAEQLHALFGGDVAGVLRDIARLALQAKRGGHDVH